MQEDHEEENTHADRNCIICDIKDSVLSNNKPRLQYRTSNWLQFQKLVYRANLSYWRSPSYNFIRMMISAIVGLLFSSAYADQKYSTDVDTISRCAVIYITLLFCGVIGMTSVQPVIFAERPAFYREQQAEMYDVRLYTLAAGLVEVLFMPEKQSRVYSVIKKIMYVAETDSLSYRLISNLYRHFLFHCWF